MRGPHRESRAQAEQILSAQTLGALQMEEFAIEAHRDAELGLAQPDGPLENGVEYRLRVVRRVADPTQHVLDRRLIGMCFREFAFEGGVGLGAGLAHGY